MSSANAPLEKRLLVLKRDGENLQLPAIKYLAGKAPKDIPPNQYLGFRIDRFESETGELWLKYERGTYGAKEFEISTDVNSEILLAHDFKKVCIINQYSNTYVSSKNFNSDINLDQRLNATRTSRQETEQQRSTIIHEIKLPVNDIHFEDGKASFVVFVNPAVRALRFEIENPFLKKEYDAIKNYFAKALGTKKILVQIKVECAGSEIFNQTATSDQIARIDDSILERVEDYIIEDEFLLNEDEIIIPADRLERAAEALGKKEIKDTAWLLNKLITQEKTKHYYHLRFLSSKQVIAVMNLRLTGKPLSFIFLLENNGTFYLVWETYKTEEATYLWKLQASSFGEIRSEAEELIERIKWLRKANKLSYIGSKPENFKRIEHDYGGADNGFKKWKALLDEFMNAKAD